MKSGVNNVVKASQLAPFRFRFCTRELNQTCPYGNLLRDKTRELLWRGYFCNAAEACQTFAHFRGLQAFVDDAIESGDNLGRRSGRGEHPGPGVEVENRKTAFN